MWKLEMVHGAGGRMCFWCKSQLAALERAREYLKRVGIVTEIHIRPATREMPNDRKGA